MQTRGGEHDLAVILDDVSRSLAEATTDYRDVVDLVVRTGGVVLEGWAAMWLVPEGGGPSEVTSVWTPDPARRTALLDALRERVLPLAGLAATEVIRTGMPVVEDELSRDELLAGVPLDRQRLLDTPQHVAVAAVPLRARGRTLGALAIYRAGAPEAFRDADVSLLQQLADRAALAIDNAALLDAAEREVAERRRVEGELLASEERLHAIASAAPVLLFACDRDGHLRVVEGGLAAELSDILVDVGDSVLDAFADHPEMLAEIRRALAGEVIRQVRLPFAGHELEAWAGPLHSPDGEIDGIAGIVVDVSERVAARAKATETARRLSALVESASDVIAAITPDGLIHYVNPAAEQVLGQPWAAGQYIDVFELIHPLDRERVRDHVRAAIRRPGVAEAIEFRIRHATGSWRTVEAIGNNLLDDPAIEAFVVTMRDVTERRAAEQRAARQAARQAGVAALGQAALERSELNELAEEALDLLVEHLGADCGQLLDAMPGAEDDVHFVQAVANVLAAATARHRAEEAVHEHARRDQLTGLPNRLALLEHLDGLLAGPTRTPLSGALLVLDVDRFKEINDTLGHQVGDQILLETADRFRRLGEQIDMVARLGGDEFAVYSSVLRSPEQLEAAARDLLGALGVPTEVGGIRLRLRGSVGVAEAGAGRAPGATSAVALLRRAEAAMYRAKRHASGYSVWTPDLDRSSVTKLGLAGELGEALDSSELLLAYQPKISCATGRPLGVEALVRWRHPLRGTVFPDSFVPLAEQTGIIKPLTAWVLEEALRQCAAWAGRFEGLTMAVNLSASTLHDPELFGAVTSALERSGVPPASVELEITESAVMHDPERALAVVTELSRIGVRFAIDDFGTGYSSLAYLQRLPVALVKIDKSFVTPLLEPGPARAIVRAVIELAHSLDIGVAAEGVETAEVAEVLVELGCDELQGFHIARPMAASRVEEWLAARWPAAAGAIGG